MPVGPFARGKARQLKRQASSQAGYHDVKMLPCVRVAGRRRYTVLPTIEIDGCALVAISPMKPWLNYVLAGNFRSRAYRGAVKNYIGEALDAIKGQAASTAESASRLGGGGGAEPEAPSQSGAKRAGRKAIFGDSDSDGAAQPRENAPKRGRRLYRPPNVVANITVRGESIMCTTLAANRGIAVVADGPYVKRILDDIRGREGERPRAVGDAHVGLMRALLAGVDRDRVVPISRVVASPAPSLPTTRVYSWQLHYACEDGRTRRFQHGLSVPRRQLSGEPLTDAEFSDGARHVLERARQLWDAADKSGAPRYGSSA